MTISSIGPYPIERELGRGGMGIVYLGRDTKLDRAVAIKVLPDLLAADRERLARFEREAKLLASLNHPNIASIYGIEEEASRRYLVLEYVDGENLSTRLDRGPLPIDEALETCRQIAAALEAAHENGVVHRDLKPGNVRLTPAGEVKVLDFGLAKGDTASESSPDLSQSPTLTHAATGVGVILGTAGYMSPEQARGKAVDRRTDIWSFGCVLFECLTGRQAFSGETVSDTIARILQGEPDWELLPAKTPAIVRRLLQRCLEKDARRRLRDIGDARVELEEAIAAGISGARTAAQEAATRTARRAPMMRGVAIGVVAGLAIAALAWGLFGRADSGGAAAKVARLSIAIPDDLRLFSIGVGLRVPMDLSADGSALVINAAPRARGEDSEDRLYVRTLDDPAFRELGGTENILGSPAITPDGRFVLFLSRGQAGSQPRLAKVPLDGSAPPTVIGAVSDAFWTFLPLPHGEILYFARDGKRYGRLSEGGQEIVPTRPIDGGDFSGAFDLDASKQAAVLNDHTVLVGTTYFSDTGWHKGVAAFDPTTGKARVVLDDGGNASYLDSGHLLFTRGENLLVARFDRGRLILKGDPLTIMSGVRTAGDYVPGTFHVGGGTLAYAGGGKVAERRSLVIVDGKGNVRPWGEELKAFNSGWVPAIAANQQVFAVVATNPRGIDEIWASDFEQSFLRRVVWSNVADCGAPQLSADGSLIAYRRSAYDVLDGIYVRELDGSGEGTRVFKPDSTERAFTPTSWSPDGSSVLITTRSGGRTVVGLARLRSAGGNEVGYRPLISGDHDNWGGCFSPDGRWIAFVSNRTGRPQVFVCSYRTDGAVGAAVPVTRSGYGPSWSADGSTVFYGDTTMVKSVKITTTPRIQAAAPARLFDGAVLKIATGQMMPNGEALAVHEADDETEITHLEVVTGWDREVARRLKGSE